MQSDRHDLIRRRLYENARLSRTVAAAVPAIDVAAGTIAQALEHGGKLLTLGNGGSAADAQHVAAELVGRFLADRKALAAIALTTDTSILTSVSNDYGFESVFVRQVEALGKAGDVLLAISTSGESENVVRAVRRASELGISAIALTGMSGSRLADACELAIVVRSTVTPRIQEMHTLVCHLLCELVERELGPGAQEEAETAPEGKVLAWTDLLSLREQWRSAGLKVVWTNGCFDLLHVGHIRGFQYARRFGDLFVVGVNTDEAVRELKGAGRPLMHAEERVELLAALEPVDYAVVFEGLTPEHALTELQPDVHCKGEEYRPPDGLPLPEQDVVLSYGGRIEFIPREVERSTSELIGRAGQVADA